MSTLKPSDAGYRGALPPRNDWLARGWVIVVIAIFIGMFVLDVLNVPTVLFPEPTPAPVDQRQRRAAARTQWQPGDPAGVPAGGAPAHRSVRSLGPILSSRG